MYIFLYTIPENENCKKVKEELQKINLEYIEQDFNIIAADDMIHEPPYMSILDGPTTYCFYTMDEILQWINNQSEQSGSDTDGLTNS